MIHMQRMVMKGQSIDALTALSSVLLLLMHARLGVLSACMLSKTRANHEKYSLQVCRNALLTGCSLTYPEHRCALMVAHFRRCTTSCGLPTLCAGLDPERLQQLPSPG